MIFKTRSESKMRRLSYTTEIKRQRIQHESGVDNTDFLRLCEMVLDGFQPTDENEIKRCWELCQRSNQLNLSTRRYTYEEFIALLASPGIRCYALKCHDRFGDYGIVAFCSVDDNAYTDGPSIIDFVISCRVAQNHVEHTFIHWLAREAFDRNKSVLRARLIKTAKNGVMADILASLPFTVTSMDESTVSFEMPLHDKLVPDNILKLVVRG